MPRLCLRISSPRFEDIKQYAKTKGVKPRKVVLIAPHENEHHAILPFQKALSDKIMAEGIQTEVENRTDGLEKYWNLRKTLDERYFKIPEIKTLHAVLRLDDCLFRIKQISNKFAENGGNTFILEMHAYRHMKEDEKCFELANKFRRLGKSLILVHRQNVSSMYSQTLKESWVQINAEWSIAKEIAKVINLPIENFDRQDTEERIKDIKRHQKEIKLIEIPSERVGLSPEHPMFPLYYSEPNVAKEGISLFEELYCKIYSHSIGFTKRDLNHVCSIIKIPAHKKDR